MSKHAKIALGCFGALFVLTRIAKLILTHMESGDMTAFITAIVFGCAGLISGIAVFVCLLKRVQSSKAPNGDPMHWGQWITLSVVSLAFMSEPIAMLCGIGISFYHHMKG